MELDKLLKKRSIISCTIKDGICIVQYASKEMKLLDISGMGIVEVLDFILEVTIYLVLQKDTGTDHHLFQ